MLERSTQHLRAARRARQLRFRERRRKAVVCVVIEITPSRFDTLARLKHVLSDKAAIGRAVEKLIDTAIVDL
jgi:hypothetical protein